ncbi:hypothetical protein SFC43_07570 [Bacteroides sp. CR5/BHMF/2]|nr:hypothetical protein [Bacteroides sp. CR5/BHMF/2]
MIVICIVGICSFSFLSAQNLADNVMAERRDSLRISTTTNFSRRLDKFSSSRFYQMMYIGIPLMVGGLIVKMRTIIFEVYVTTICPVSIVIWMIICNMPLLQ